MQLITKKNRFISYSKRLVPRVGFGWSLDPSRSGAPPFSISNLSGKKLGWSISLHNENRTPLLMPVYSKTPLPPISLGEALDHNGVFFFSTFNPLADLDEIDIARCSTRPPYNDSDSSHIQSLLLLSFGVAVTLNQHHLPPPKLHSLCASKVQSFYRFDIHTTLDDTVQSGD